MKEIDGHIKEGDLKRQQRARSKCQAMFPSLEEALSEIRDVLNQGTAEEKKAFLDGLRERSGSAFDDVFLAFLRDNLEMMAYGDVELAFLPGGDLRWPKSPEAIAGRKPMRPKKKKKKRKE